MVCPDPARSRLGIGGDELVVNHCEHLIMVNVGMPVGREQDSGGGRVGVQSVDCVVCRRDLGAVDAKRG